jgi:ADP-ribose pyrophosphatase YjhB (NUDIX family)
LEEIGCEVKIGEYLGFLEEFRDNDKRHQITHCFVAEVVGEKGLPQTEQEDEAGMEVEWFGFDEAIEKMRHQIEIVPFERYNSCFNVRLSQVFLLEYKKKHA